MSNPSDSAVVAPVILLELKVRRPEYCGGCQFEMGGSGYCQIWEKYTERGSAIPGSKGGREFLRLPECLAAGTEAGG